MYYTVDRHHIRLYARSQVMRLWDVCRPCCDEEIQPNVTVGTQIFAPAARTFYFHTNSMGRHSITEWANCTITVGISSWTDHLGTTFNGSHILTNSAKNQTFNGQPHDFGLGSAGTFERIYSSNHLKIVGAFANGNRISASFRIGAEFPNSLVTIIYASAAGFKYRPDCTGSWKFAGFDRTLSTTDQEFYLARISQEITVNGSF